MGTHLTVLSESYLHDRVKIVFKNLCILEFWTKVALEGLKLLCIETSTSLGSLRKFEGAEGEFKGASGSS